MERTAEVDVLIVGAGPTGLTLAAQLHAFGVRFRIVDRLLDRTRESRALAVQARSLEILQNLGGLGDRLVARGRTTTRFAIHFETHVVEAQLGFFGASHTRFPYILFVSQAETETILGDHLASHGVTVERGIELASVAADDAALRCTLHRADGSEQCVRARYVAGCDGAHSTVRHEAGIPFEGGDYEENFVLADVEANGPIERDTLHAFAGRHGFALFFPLGSPTTWRIIAISPGGPRAEPDAPMTSALSLDELQSIVDGATGGSFHLHDPAWLARFRLHHRQTTSYRAGRMFLAGDAAHIHSPVGGQGMNTGIQDAWNLGWKLALVVRAQAEPQLLDTYQSERWPVGQALLHTTDRAFSLFTRAMSDGALATWLRREVVSRILPRLLSSRRLRARAFRFISELAIRYRESVLSMEGAPRLRSGPRAGDRLPDAQLTRDGRQTTLHQELSGPRFHLLLCGMPDAWDQRRLTALRARFGGLLSVHTVGPSEREGALVDPAGELLAYLGVRESAQYLVRPDGYIGFRCAGQTLDGVARYLERWIPRGEP
jgi:2-polyprenyl-6-methoxyphenol hydroxylase-like FAD-dependent oxidoreductase